MKVREMIRRALRRAISIACLTLVLTSAGCESFCEFFIDPDGSRCGVYGTKFCTYQVFYDDGEGCAIANSTVTTVLLGLTLGGTNIADCDRICSQSCVSCLSGPCP